jgi:hypothetical protein
MLASFWNFLFRNFLGTGFIIRVPMGFPCLFINTTEFSLSISLNPFFMWHDFLKPIIIAFVTSFFFTLDVVFDLFRSFCTDTIILSPKFIACFLLNPPNILIHLTVFAPELSADF